MRFTTGTRRGERVLAAAIAAATVPLLTGCPSPPSVSPLMRAAERTLAEERRLLADDAERRTQRFEQLRKQLRDGFEADLETREKLTPEWVMSGTEAYTAAREGLLRQQLDLKRQTRQRRRNLKDARGALSRARRLLQKQDRLLRAVPDVRRWLRRQINEPSTRSGTDE